MTTSRFDVQLDTAKALTAQQECSLVGEAVRRNPCSPLLRSRLAKLLNFMDEFEDSIALLTKAPPDSLSSEESMELARALLARAGPGDAKRAITFAERAAELAHSDAQRSVALSEVAKAYLRADDSERAVVLLEEALQLDAGNSLACKRLMTHWLRQRESHAVLDLAGRLEARGVRHSRLLASRVIALVQLGKIEDARSLLDLEELVEDEELSPPPGWGDLQSFNAVLAQELLVHPGLRFGRYGTASQNTWRIDAPATGASPAARALLARLIEAVQRRILTSKDPASLWTDSRPDRALVESWCVITRADGFEDWHMHHKGWMSGVYYVEAPPAVRESDEEAGCLIFGLPEGLVGKGAAEQFGRRLVRPRPGLLALFPSHSYHRTFPHRSPARRMCVSFDVVPA